jgi:hypothetical protein
MQSKLPLFVVHGASNGLEVALVEQRYFLGTNLSVPSMANNLMYRGAYSSLA